MKNLKRKFKKAFKGKSPVMRNLAVVIGAILILYCVGFVATAAKWVLSLGTKTLVTIAVTAIVSAILFGIADGFSSSDRDKWKKSGKLDFQLNPIMHEV